MTERNCRWVPTLFWMPVRIVIIVTVLVALSGCANLSTIHRSTMLPGNAKAVHLDIHQRAIIATADKYCAEPSPDGLAAYAAAIGLSVGKPVSEAGSLTSSGSSSVASAGLRTQSITLMRDLMYRICEASANKSLGDANLAVLLGQSQDLATVILAIEQLTGPVAASQAALIAGTQASSTATIAANAKQLEILTEALERANKGLEEAKAEKTAKEKEIETTQAEKDLKTAAQTQAQAEENQELSDTLKAETTVLTNKLSDLNAELALAEQQEAFRQGIVDDAKATRDKVLESQDSALASGSTRTSGSNAFDSQSPANKLAADASIKVAETVENIVKHSLDKKYLDEACISLITTPIPTISATMDDKEKGAIQQQRTGRLELQASCVALINSTIDKQRSDASRDAAEAQLDAAKADAKRIVLQSKSAMDKVMNCITDNGAVNAGRVTAILALPRVAVDLSNTLNGRKAQQVRTFLATRADQLQELAQRIDTDPGICLR